MQSLVRKSTFEVTCLVIFVMEAKWSKKWGKFNKNDSFCEACLDACFDMGKALEFLKDRKQIPQTITEIQELQRIIRKMIDEIMSKAWGLLEGEEKLLIHEYKRYGALARLYLKYKKLEITQEIGNNPRNWE